MMTEHEANRATTVMMRSAIGPAAILTGDCLGRLSAICSGLELSPERMRQNLDLTGGMILSEAIMMELGKTLGRQEAHDVIYEAAEDVLSGVAVDFDQALAARPEIKQNLSADAIAAMLNPTAYTGLCADMAHEQAARARHRTIKLKTEN
jgi:3-carboxy-cis,cis-muconate cycloisomerase